MPDHEHLDDETIQDGDALWRRVPASPSFLALDAKLGHYRVASSAFDNDRDDDPMSVFVARESSLEIVLRGHEGFGVVEFSAGFARSQGQAIYFSPDDGPRGHAKVDGPKTGGVRRAFARVARWVRRPPGYDERSLPDPAPGSYGLLASCRHGARIDALRRAARLFRRAAASDIRSVWNGAALSRTWNQPASKLGSSWRSGW
jgi:hypothetical protein